MTTPGGNVQPPSISKTVTDTIVGSHTHTIVGYSLVKGIGDGEPIASERFCVGGHEWVLLFYPDGKRSSSTEGAEGQPAAAGMLAAAAAAGGAGFAAAAANRELALDAGAGGELMHNPFAGGGAQQAAAAAAGGAAAMAAALAAQQAAAAARPRRDTVNEYAALFVALIGEGPNPQGIVNTSEGKVVRAFHRFTLVDQVGTTVNGRSEIRDLTKGRTRDAGAVKISCARQDPNARNCHGYRKFVKRAILEDPNRGFLHNDSIIIKYTIELVVSTGGALARCNPVTPKADLIRVPPSSLGPDMAGLFASGKGADFTFLVEGESMKAHKIILEARSEVFARQMNSNMRDSVEGVVPIEDIKAPVFRAMLVFIYTDALPEELEGQGNMDVAMAQHLLVAADRYGLERLRRICERRLCETVDIKTVATTLTLAEQNNGLELKKVCLEFVSKNLAEVLATEGYLHMTHSCPSLQSEILATIASAEPSRASSANHDRDRERSRHSTRAREPAEGGGDERRVRARLD